jgi:hypothetical protein
MRVHDECDFLMQVESLRSSLMAMQRTKDSDVEKNGHLLAQAHADAQASEQKAAELQQQVGAKAEQLECMTNERNAACARLQQLTGEMEQMSDVCCSALLCRSCLCCKTSMSICCHCMLLLRCVVLASELSALYGGNGAYVCSYLSRMLRWQSREVLQQSREHSSMSSAARRLNSALEHWSRACTMWSS